MKFMLLKLSSLKCLSHITKFNCVSNHLHWKWCSLLSLRLFFTSSLDVEQQLLLL